MTIQKIIFVKLKSPLFLKIQKEKWDFLNKNGSKILVLYNELYKFCRVKFTKYNL